MSFFMAVSMSTAMLLVNFGFFDGFFHVLARVLLLKSLPVSILMIFIFSKLFRKIKGKKSRIISGATMGLITSFFVTFEKMHFFSLEFFIVWGKSFAIGFLIAAVFVVLYVYLVTKILSLFFVDEQKLTKKSALA